MRNLLFLAALSCFFCQVDAFQNQKIETHATTRVSFVVLYQDISENSGASVASSSTIKEEPRSLEQNWWPVTLSAALDPSKPNPIELLDKKLVLWQTSQGKWSCVEDQCPHRFAPLSEGRVVNNTKTNCIECAYHGWQLNGQGSCTRIPQLEAENQQALPSVQSYPVHETAGMVWVWADPATRAANSQQAIPISGLLQRFHQVGGTARGFMRDLPYGFEFLGENLVDASHLPFSHHSIGLLDRKDGRPVPLKMLSREERMRVSEKLNGGAKLPLFQAQVVNAAEHDPELVAAMKRPAVKDKADPNLAVSAIGFFDPCHVRYHRNPGIPGSSYEIQLFMCPTSAGKSRVLLFSPMENQLPPVPKEGRKEDTTRSKNDDADVVAKKYQPSVFMERSANQLFGRKKKQPAAFPPHFGHMISHSIFDGDGIFLHKQGDRMRRSNLTYRDYNTPTSSDVLVNAFRRWLDKAADATMKAGGQKAALAATGGAINSYQDDQTRADMLDRYTSHTANCKVCLAALKEFKKKKEKMGILTTALVGASGASGVLALSAAIVAVTSRLVLGIWSRISAVAMVSFAAATAGSVLGAKRTRQKIEAIDKEIRRFYFEDYVHAEKN